MPVLAQIKGLTLSYDNKVVLSGLDLTVNEGDYLCIVGQNGSGKSTLIKALLGLHKPEGGSITYQGVKQAEIGYLPQQTRLQRDFPASAMEVVLSGCLNRHSFKPFYTKDDKLSAKENMEKLDILSLADECYRELSGGQQQRVLLARALCATRKLLLLDEPVTGLDPVAAHDLYAVIKDINRNKGITVIMVTHDIHCALHEATHILHLDAAARFFGTRRDYEHSEIGKRFAEVGHD